MRLVELVGAVDEAAVAAIDDRDGTLTYGELRAQARSVAAQIGTSPTLVMLEGGAEIAWLVAYVGCLIGGHPVLVVPAGDQETADRLSQLYQPEYVLMAADGYRPRRIAGPSGVALHPELAVLLSTSGSTGSSKCVRLSHANITANARSIATYLQIGPDERGVVSLPTHYSYGLSIVNSHLAAGATLLLTGRSVIEPEFWDFCQRHGATSFAGVPYSYQLLQRIDLARRAPSSLRYFTQAGGRLSPDLVRHFAAIAQAQHWRFYVMYGQTEATARMAYLPPELLDSHADCVGIAIPDGRFDLVDAEGRELSGVLEQGELVYSGPNVMMGYATGPADLALPAGPPRLPTGDLAERTPDGLIRITGRLSRFIKVFGNRLGLDDVEQILERAGLPAIATGVDERLLVVTRDASAPPAIIALLTERLHLPADRLTVRAVEDYPQLASGKIDYAGLKATLVAEIVAEQQARDVAPVAQDRGAAVRRVFADLLNGRDDEARSFTESGGDSLTYISAAVALESLIPNLPEDWAERPLGDLTRLAEGAKEAPAPAQRAALPTNLETVRALACMMVVALHVVGVTAADGLRLPLSSHWHQAMQVLALVRMPLFTAMAGFFYALVPASRTGFLPFMRRKADSLLWPLLFATLVYWSMRKLTAGVQISLIDAYLTTYLHLWYLDALLIWFLVVSLLDTAFRMTTLRWVAVIAVGLVLRADLPFSSFLDAPDILEMFPFFVLGILLQRTPALWNGRHPWIFGLAAVLFGVGVWHALHLHSVPYVRNNISMLASLGAVVLAIGLTPRIRAIEPIAIFTFSIFLWHPAANAAARTLLLKLGVHSIPLLFLCGMVAGIVAPIILHRAMQRCPAWLRAPVIGR